MGIGVWQRRARVILVICLPLFGTACIEAAGAGRAARLDSEDGCAVAISVLDCRLSHAKAGGYPITPSLEPD